MKLHSPHFQRQLRRGVKKAIRESRELKKEYRKAKKIRKSVVSAWVFRCILSQALGFAVLVITTRTRHPVTGLAVITLWTFGLIFFHAQGLWAVLHTHPDITALRLMPVSEETIFRWQLQKFLRPALMSLLDLAIGFGILGLFLWLSPAQWLVVPLITLMSWLTLMALDALCVIHVSRKVYGMFAASLFIFGFFLLFGFNIAGNLLLNLLDRTAPDLNLLLPTGWAVSLFQLLLPKGLWSALLLFPVALVIWSLKNSLKRLRNEFRFEEHILPVAPDLVPGMDVQDLMDEHDVMEASPAAQSSQHLGLTAIDEMVDSRLFLVPESWHQRGRYEKWLWNWMDAREKVLSDFVFPMGSYAITAPWLKTLRNLVIAVAAALIVGLVSPTGKLWILGFGLFITGLQALAQTMNNGVAFRPMFCSGVNIPVYAGFGIGYLELSHLLIKCSVVQLPLFIPFITVCGTLVTMMFHLPWQMGVIIGFKASILLFAARFIFIMFAFSGGTNDSSKFRVRTLMLFAAILSLGGAFLGLGAASLLVPTPVAWIFPVLAVLDAYVLFAVYGRFYHANRFDLMNIPRR
jgi:hypothetical protein